MKKTLVAAVTGLFVTVGVTLAAAPAAEASTNFGCTFPRVCFYKTKADFDKRKPTASFKDRTSSSQTLGVRSIGSYAVYNSRNDDGAIILSFVTEGNSFDNIVDNDVRCVRPNTVVFFPKNIVTREITIVNPPNC